MTIFWRWCTYPRIINTFSLILTFFSCFLFFLILLGVDWDLSAQRLFKDLFRGFPTDGIIQLLVEKGVDVNAQGGDYGNALQAASNRGHEGIVQLLVKKGAEVNAQVGGYGNALQAASNRGHEGILQLLVKKGADVNAQGGWYGNALQVASNHGYEGILQLLIKKGADVNAQGGWYGNAMRAASEIDVLSSISSFNALNAPLPRQPVYPLCLTAQVRNQTC